MKLIKKGSQRLARFYEFSQTNSGGSYDHDEERGIGHVVYVEAMSAADANSRAETIGLYFDGYGDCLGCCGYRWSEQWSDTRAFTWDEAIEEIATRMTGRWARYEGEGHMIFLHRLDGSVFGFWSGDDEEDNLFLKQYLQGAVKY